MFSRRSQMLGFALMLHDVALTAAAFLVAFAIRSQAMPSYVAGRYIPPIYPLATYWPLLLGIVLLWPVLGYGLGLYREVQTRPPREVARDLVKLTFFGFLILLAGLFLFKAEHISRTFVAMFVAVDAIMLAISRWVVLFATTWFRQRFERYRYFLIVGTGTAAHELATLIEDGEVLGFRLHGFVQTGDDASAIVPGPLRHSYPLIHVEQVPEILHTHVIDEILFAVSQEELPKLEPLMLACETEGVHIRVQLDFLPRTFSRVYLEHLRHVPLLTFSSGPTNELELLAKRILDTTFAFAALVVLSPVFLVLAVLIKLTSRGPVLYRQTRCGLGGRKFTLLKFRSMVENADQLRAQLEPYNELDGPVFKMKDDPRCTPLGRWLRKLSIDELPQLWNIVRGDMSFVGPRPPIPQEVERYESWQRRRLRMRPGLTCLWALEGRNHVNFEHWMQLDLLYLDNWSLWLDVKIFLRTIPLVLLGHGAS
jgi:exopolysaccharide biosynthesis polyprenyl glycosylphosphotransferase